MEIFLISSLIVIILIGKMMSIGIILNTGYINEIELGFAICAEKLERALFPSYVAIILVSMI